MLRLVVIALFGATVVVALPSPLALAGTPRPDTFDEQEGTRVTVRGILTVKKKGTIKETFWVDDYKLRGLPRDKLIEFVGERVVVTGEFRVVLGDLVIYAREIEKAPERDDDSL